MPKNHGMGFSVKGDIKQVTRYLTAIEKKHTPKATSQALNRTRQKLLTLVMRSISKRFRVKRKLIKGRLSFTKATPRKLGVTIRGFWSDIPLIRFGRARETRTGVKVGRQSVPGGFIAVMRSGHHAIMKRHGADRLPIDEQKVSIRADAHRITTVHVKRKALRIFLPEFNRLMTRSLKR